MRYLTLGAVIWCVMGAAGNAQVPDPQVVALTHKFIDSFNKGDAAAAAATHATEEDLAITDEVPPYFWRGPQAFKAWSAALDTEIKKLGITDPLVTLKAATRTEVDGDSAYVVVPAVYTYKQKGVAMREAGQMTFVLKKGAGGWLIHGWTWAGPKPQRAAASAKP